MSCIKQGKKDGVAYFTFDSNLIYQRHNTKLYPVDLEVWRNLAQRARIKRIASKFVCHFDCDWQRVRVFSHSVTLTRVLLSQIISYSDTKASVLVVMECKLAYKCNICIGVFTSYFKVNRV